MQRLTHSIFARNVIIFMSGAAIAQVFNVAASPILSRLYEPAAFGLFAFFISTVTLLEIAVTGRYEQAIVLPENEEDAANVMGLALLLTSSLSVGAILLVWFGGTAFAHAFGVPELVPWLWLIPPYLFVTGIYNSLNYWSTRHKQFSRLSISQIFRAGGTVGIQILVGFIRGGAVGLIGGKVVGQSLASVSLFLQVWRDDRHKLHRLVSWGRFKTVARRYRDFPRYGAPQALLNSLSLGVFTFLMTPFFGPTVVGYYALTKKVLGLPARLLGEAIRQVFFPKATELMQTGGDVYRFLLMTTFGLLAIGSVPTLIVVLFGPQLFAFVFGAEWYRAGIYAQVLMPWTYIALANPPSVMMIPILNKQSAHMVYEIVSLVSRIAAIFAGVAIGNDIWAIAIFSLVGVLLNGSLIVYMLWLTKQRSKMTMPLPYDRFIP